MNTNGYYVSEQERIRYNLLVLAYNTAVLKAVAGESTTSSSEILAIARGYYNYVETGE